MFMPSDLGKELLFLPTTRPSHQGGHKQYNKYVARVLNHINSNDELLMFVASLRVKLNTSECDLPWK